MTKQELYQWIEKSYSTKGVSGRHKMNQGFVLANGGLYCNLCNTTILMKSNQHLVGKIHQDEYKKKKLSEDMKTKTLLI